MNHKQIEISNAIRKYEKKIRRFSKELSRRKEGSNNYYKIRKKLAIYYQKLGKTMLREIQLKSK